MSARSVLRSAWLAGLMAAFLTVPLCGGAAAQSLPLPFADPLEARRISTVVFEGRMSMTGLPPQLINARRRMFRGERLVDPVLRRLADRGDGLAAQRYVRRLIARGDAQNAASDLAWYSSFAVGTGRIWTLPDMIVALRRLDPASEPPERIARYRQVLAAYAAAGNSAALAAFVDHSRADGLFGAPDAETRQWILDRGAGQGDGRTEMRLALSMLTEGDAASGETRRLLEIAAQTSHPGQKAAAQSLLRRLDQGG